MSRADRRLPDLRMQIVRRPLWERQPSGEQLVNGHAEPEHVGRRRNRLAQTFLGGHVRMGAGVTRRARLNLKTGNTEVEQNRTTVRQNDVRRLYVHVQETALVNVL